MAADIIETLRTSTETDPPGIRVLKGYPIDFQVPEFPKYGDGYCTGNNNAFFFAKAVTEEKDGKKVVVDIEQNTAALKKLIGTISSQRDNAPNGQRTFLLQVDADLFEKPERFLDKYASMRPEANGRDLLAKEAEVIRNFVNGTGNEGGIRVLTKEVLAEQGKDDSDAAVGKFLKENFRLQGVRTDTKLPGAAWKIETDKGTFFATQDYKLGTDKLNRPWVLGVTPELNLVAEVENDFQPHAIHLLKAVKHVDSLPVVDLTHGLKASEKPKLEAAPRPTGQQSPEM